MGYVISKLGNKKTLLLLLIFSFGVLIRVIPINELTKGSISYNEGLTMVGATKSIFKDGLVLGSKDQAFLRYFILHYFLYFGRSEFIIRLPALLFGLASLLLAYKVGKDFFGVEVGLLTIFLLAVSLWHIHYSTYAGMYTLYSFLALLSVYFLYKAITVGGWLSWTGFTAANVLLFYSFYPAISLFLAEIFWFLLFLRLFRESRKMMVIAFIIIGCFFLSAIPLLKIAIDWKSAYGDFQWGIFSQQILQSIFYDFNGINNFLFPVTVLLWGLGIFFLSPQRNEFPQRILLFLAVIVPIVFIMLVSSLLKINIAERYFLFTYPFFIILVARGIAVFKNKLTKLFLLIVVNLSALVFVFCQSGFATWDLLPREYFRRHGKFDLIAKYLVTHYRSGDAVVIEHDPGIFAIQYYLDPENERAVRKVIPSCGNEPYYRYDGKLIKNVFGLTEYDGNTERLQRFAQTYERFWLVDLNLLQYSDRDGKIENWIKTYASSEIEFNGGRIFLFEKFRQPRLTTIRDGSLLYSGNLCSLNCKTEEIEIQYPFNLLKK